MTPPTPFSHGHRPTDEEPHVAPFPGAPPQADPQPEYSSEEVSEIIRVALRRATADPQSMVNHDELLAIGKDLGLSPADLTAALDEIASSRDQQGRAIHAKQMFRLHVACYAVVITGLFLVNWVTLPSFSWFLLPATGWGMLLALHGLAVKFAPDLPGFLLRKAIGLSRELADARRTSRIGSTLATFTVPDVLAGLAEAQGIAHLQDNVLTLEFETKDSIFGLLKSGLREQRIPVDEIDAVLFENKMFKTQLRLQARLMRTFRHVPGAKAGQLTLVFEQHARDASKQLARQLARAIDEGRRTET